MFSKQVFDTSVTAPKQQGIDQYQAGEPAASLLAEFFVFLEWSILTCSVIYGGASSCKDLVRPQSCEELSLPL